MSRRKTSADRPMVSSALVPWLLGEVAFEELSHAAVWDFLALTAEAPEGFLDDLRDALIDKRVIVGNVAHKRKDWQLFFSVLRAQGATTTQ